MGLSFRYITGSNGPAETLLKSVAVLAGVVSGYLIGDYCAKSAFLGSTSLEFLVREHPIIAQAAGAYVLGSVGSKIGGIIGRGFDSINGNVKRAAARENYPPRRA